jgi:heme-degrading monooxygenase HmoA
LNQNKVIELVLFRLREDLPDEEVVAASGKINPVLHKMPGFISRNLAKTEDGQWADVVYWDSMINAKQAAKNILEYNECKQYFGMIDTETSQMKHFEILC